MIYLNGRNDLILNPSTMRDAVAYWLYGRVLSGGTPEVISVKERRDGTFYIKLEGNDE